MTDMRLRPPRTRRNDMDGTMAYAARFPGKPGFGAVCVDDPDHPKDTAKDIAGWIRRGATVERVTVEAARAGMVEYLDARKAARPSSAGAGGV